jgi:WD40 repeat protein
VVSLAAMPPGVVSEAPAGGFVAGSLDKIIRVYDLEVTHQGTQSLSVTACDLGIPARSRQGNRVRMLIGHGHGVISLSWTPSGHLISGSWDGTAKVGRAQACLHRKAVGGLTFSSPWAGLGRGERCGGAGAQGPRERRDRAG